MRQGVLVSVLNMVEMNLGRNSPERGMPAGALHQRIPDSGGTTQESADADGGDERGVKCEQYMPRLTSGQGVVEGSRDGWGEKSERDVESQPSVGTS